MTCLITIPLKKGYDVDLIKPLKNLISSYYSSLDNQIDLTGPIEQLNKLRQSCVSKNLDTKNESSLELYQRYYDQISSLESKCPPNEIQIPFKWKNAFDKGNSFFISTGNMTLSNIKYEKVCVLFNIAAIATQMSNSLSDNLKNDAFLKNSAKNYQLASGIFLGLKQLVGTIGQELTWDLNGDLLKELSLIMLAQAQEIFFFKAYNDNLKNSILAKICKHCFDLYFEASSNIDALNSEKEFLAKLVSIKQCAFAGLTEYFQALVCQEEKKIGEELVRFSKCIEYLEDAEYIAESNFPYSFSMILEKAKRNYAETKKDNDFIYHAIIPTYQSLNPVQRAEIAKPTPIPTSFLKNPDPFSNLLPVTVQQAITKLDLRKNELVTTTINSLREAVKNLNTSLTMMNLPAAVEDTNTNKLPDSLLKKSQEIRNSGGYLGLESKFSMLPDLLKRNEEIFNVTNKLIVDEENTDSNLRRKYGDKYTILASENVNKYWKEQIAKYRSVLDNAIKADSTIKTKFETNKSKFILLSKSEKEITESLPSIGYGSSLMNSEPAQKLRLLLKEVDSLRKEALKLEEDLKNQTFDDMKNKFLSALQSDGAINEEALSVESLGQTYGPLQKQLRTFLEKEEDLQNRIQVTYSDFSELKNKTNSSDQRDVFLTDLAKGSDVFEELTRNINEGTNFYNDLTKLLISLQNRINDFCFARETERNELVDFLSKGNNSKEDNKNIVSSAPSTTTQNSQPNMPFAAPQYPTPYTTPYPQVFYPPAVPQGYGAYPSYYVPGQYNPQAQPYPYPPPQNYPGYPQQPPNQ